MIAARRWFPDTVPPGSRWSSSLPETAAGKYLLVFLGRGHPQIGSGKDGEKQRLNERDQDVQSDEK